MQCGRCFFKTLQTLEIKAVTIETQIICCLEVHFVHDMLTTVLEVLISSLNIRSLTNSEEFESLEELSHKMRE